MFKISKLIDANICEFKIGIYPVEIHSFSKGCKKVNIANLAEFMIKASNDLNEYLLSFRFSKPLEDLYNIELNTSVDINNYIDEVDSFLEVNDSFECDVVITGKIYRIINSNIIIKGLFMSDNNDIYEEDYSGKFEIEFNLNEYMNKNEKSDI